MKAQQENTQEPQKEIVQRVQQESSTGGEATIVDNRSAIAVQRKLRASMGNTDSNKQSIQRKNNTGLPDNLKSGIENLSGYSMDDVRVHYNSSKPAQLQAHAYAQGTDIHLAPGQEKHLPHEAWHVVQQKQGRVKPTIQLKSKVNINDDAGLEKEADVMGAKATKVNGDQGLNDLKKKSLNLSENSVQGYFYEGNFQHDNKRNFIRSVLRYFDKLDENRFDARGVELGFTEDNLARDTEVELLAELLWAEYGETENRHMEMEVIELAYQSSMRNDRAFEGLPFFELIKRFNKARINFPWSVDDTLKLDRSVMPNRRMALGFAWKNKKENPDGFKRMKANAENPHQNALAPIVPQNQGVPAAQVNIPLGNLFMSRGASVFNTDSDKLVLGRYRPSFGNDANPIWEVPGNDSYVAIAKELGGAYFNMGADWARLKAAHNIQSDLDMFIQLNIPVLWSAIHSNKTIVFTHHPEADNNSMLFGEWQFLQVNGGFTGLRETEYGYWEAT